MQRYAEEAVSKHMQDLQKTFFKEKKGRSYAPFSRDVTREEIDGILERTKRQSERYRVLKKSGASKEEIDENFKTPVPMQVFSYEGMIDTLMSPLDSIRYHKHFLRCGMYSIDARNGHVKAYVGGPDFRQFQYDMATEGRRQVGSTVKPYLYTLAMEEGMWPCDKVTYQPITLLDANGREWSPKNSDKKADDLIGKEVTLQWGLTNSNNWISAYLMSLYTPESLVKLLRSFGMRGPIDPVISLCLGPCEISVAEMADAYTAFPNKGIRIEPIYVTHIEDKNGNLIATFVPKTHEIFSAETSYKMIHMLRNVIDHGTGVRVRYKYGLDMQMGGKTGTTQNNSDGWFMGFTPSLVTGVWVGGEDRSIHFDRISDGQGANMALPIWALYMKEVLNNPDIEYSLLEEFDIPEEFNPNAGCQSL
jgi:penicillin-binding protein 1A